MTLKTCCALLLALCVPLTACSDEDPQETPVADVGADAGDATRDVAILPDATEDAPDAPDVSPDVSPQIVSDAFAVRASVEQIHVWRAPANTEIEVLAPDGTVTAATTDDLGSLIFRDVPPAEGYVVRLADEPTAFTDMLDVTSIEGSLPEEAFYADQVLEPGFGYIETRDGTKLSVFVSMPGPPEDGPYPTLVNYSGYSPSRPGESVGGAAEAFCGTYPILCDAPDFPSGLIMGLLGYAVVGVNIRGTGCSGGAYDFFEPLELLDGYDAIETVAHQDWAKFHKVGMVGLSYPGISQLYVASTNPPSLAAIAPFSVIANTFASTLVPGGILNDGFAVEWITHVVSRAVPYGDPWVEQAVASGDTVCEDNQFLHSQAADVIGKIYANPYYTDTVSRPLDPSRFVDRIDVPVFMVGQWQDEQTGPHFPVLFDKFSGAPIVRFTATNGVHIDGFSPQILAEWANFESLYVAHEIPSIPAPVRTMVPMFMDQVYGAPIDLPPARFDDAASYEEALAAYEAEDPLRIIFESGAAVEVEAGAPQGTFEQTFSGWPLPDTVATRWYFQPGGELAETLPPADGGGSSFELDPSAGNGIFLGSGTVEVLQPDYDYRQLVEGKALSFLSAPLTEDLVMVGHGSVDLWLQTDASDQDADLEVTLTEVRPDGQESFVQNGWLRATQRTLAAGATELRPIQTHTEADALPLEEGVWNAVRVELMPFGHIFRSGSQLRLSVDTPGDSTARWRFLLNEYDVPPIHRVAHSADYPSSVVLPVIGGIDVPTALPPCEALRGQPCRPYEAFTNAPLP